MTARLSFRQKVHLAREDAIVGTVKRLLAEKGFDLMTVDEVAAEVGIAKASLYKHFPSKEDLFKAVVRESISGYYPVWVAELESFSGSTADLLRKCLGTWWERVGASRASGISKLMLSEARNFPDLRSALRQKFLQST